MAKQMNNWMEELNGYAKRSFAEKKANDLLGKLDVRWFIYQQQNGRFAIVAIDNNKGIGGMIAHMGIAVMN